MSQSYPRRLAAALVAVTVGLLASAAAIPPAFAQQTQATVRHAAAGGPTGWQVALLGISLPLGAAAVTVLLRVVRGARRAAPTPTA